MTKQSKRFTWLAMTVIAAAAALIVGQAVVQKWPYNLVSYPQGNVFEVEPSEIGRGGEIIVTIPEYCNAGVDVRVRRYIELLGPDDAPVAAYELPAVLFFVNGTAPGCLRDIKQSVAIPDYILGPMGQDARVRLVTLTVYEPNSLATVEVPAYTDPFVISR